MPFTKLCHSINSVHEVNLLLTLTCVYATENACTISVFFISGLLLHSKVIEGDHDRMLQNAIPFLSPLVLLLLTAVSGGHLVLILIIISWYVKICFLLFIKPLVTFN